jgi:hypothetical protein
VDDGDRWILKLQSPAKRHYKTVEIRIRINTKSLSYGVEKYIKPHELTSERDIGKWGYRCHPQEHLSQFRSCQILEQRRVTTIAACE